MKKITFYMNGICNESKILHGYENTLRAIQENRPDIHTTQIMLLKGSLFEKGYRIFVQETDAEVFEIKLGTDNERTDREIRTGHNLANLLVVGEFAKRE